MMKTMMVDVVILIFLAGCGGKDAGPLGRQKVVEIVSHQQAVVTQGILRTARGEGIPLLLKRGMEGEWFTIQHVPTLGKPQTLFELESLLESYGVALEARPEDDHG
jgi:hypothetical protein